MTKGDNNFNVKFVKLIEKYDAIYNHFSEHYNNREQQADAWSAIAEQMNETVCACKERWINLRASFCRHLRNQRIMTSNRKPYYLAQHMEFLIPFTRLQPLPDEGDDSPGRPSMVDSDIHFIQDTNQRFQQMPTELEIHKVESSPGWNTPLMNQPNTSVCPVGMSSPTYSCRSPQDYEKYNDDCGKHVNQTRKRKFVPAIQTTVGTFQNYGTNSIIDDDPDVLFLKSILPDIRKMSDRQKCRFKRLLLGVVDDVLYAPTESAASDLLLSGAKSSIRNTPLSYTSNSD